MTPTLKLERQTARYLRTCKSPFRRIIRLSDADRWVKSDIGTRAIRAMKYHDRAFERFWKKVTKKVDSYDNRTKTQTQPAHSNGH